MKLYYSLTILFCFCSAHLTAQDEKANLELSKIMSGNEFIGQQPENLNWSADNAHIYFSWGKDDYDNTIWFDYDIAAKKYTKLDSYKETRIPIRGQLSDQEKVHYYFRNKNDILTIENGKTEKIFSFYSKYRIEKIMKDGALILYISGQIVEYNPKAGTFIQLVKNVRESDKPEDDFLSKQQDELIESIEAKNDKHIERESSRLPELLLKNSLAWFEIDDNRWSMLYQETEYVKTTKTKYASYVTKDGFTELKDARPKVGRENPANKLALVDFRSNMHYTVDITSLSGINDAPDYYKYYEDLQKVENPKEVVYHNHGSSPNGELFLVEIKSYDNKDRWICTVNHQGELNELDHQRDTAWIGGPGISGWTSVGGNVGWIDNDNIYFQSEETGYSHLYSYNLSKKKKNQLTEGKYEIHGATLSKSKDKFFITANHNHPGNREFYTLDINTKKLTAILTLGGNHEVHVSPDETKLAIRYSYINKPWELYIAPLQENTQMEQLTDSRSEAFKAYAWREPAVINFPASDGTMLNARLYFPESGKGNGAGIIFVHGAGYLQNAHNWWSGYYREYMFHNFLADKGYTIMDIDYRASKGYGRDFRTAIYRHMGGLDLSDQLDGRQYLIDTYKLDSSRIGIYGGSYGGFITLMALLTEPGKFKCGAALRSVTDWAHYNHPYTSNILNTPEKDPKAFEISSPIYFAENLEDRLIMLHGMEDDNVQYQDVVRLSQRFIELGKKNWDLIGYPVEPHGFKETASWVDEYRRIMELFDAELLKN